jgi:hypothetical protein
MYGKALINPSLQQSSEAGGLGHPLVSETQYLVEDTIDNNSQKLYNLFV